jgi:hypothetical protein
VISSVVPAPLGLAAVSPQHAWQQPILRLADTVVGVAVGAMAAWTGIRVRRFLPDRSVPPDPAKVKVDGDGRCREWSWMPPALAALAYPPLAGRSPHIGRALRVIVPGYG